MTELGMNGMSFSVNLHGLSLNWWLRDGGPIVLTGITWLMRNNNAETVLNCAELCCAVRANSSRGGCIRFRNTVEVFWQ